MHFHIIYNVTWKPTKQFVLNVIILLIDSKTNIKECIKIHFFNLPQVRVPASSERKGTRPELVGNSCPRVPFREMSLRSSRLLHLQILDGDVCG